MPISWLLSFFSFVTLHIWTFCLHTYTCEMCTCLVPAEDKRGHHTGLELHTEGYELPCGNSARAASALNSPGPPLQILNSFFFDIFTIINSILITLASHPWWSLYPLPLSSLPTPFPHPCLFKFSCSLSLIKATWPFGLELYEGV